MLAVEVDGFEVGRPGGKIVGAVAVVDGGGGGGGGGGATVVWLIVDIVVIVDDGSVTITVVVVTSRQPSATHVYPGVQQPPPKLAGQVVYPLGQEMS